MGKFRTILLNKTKLFNGRKVTDLTCPLYIPSDLVASLVLASFKRCTLHEGDCRESEMHRMQIAVLLCNYVVFTNQCTSALSVHYYYKPSLDFKLFKSPGVYL